ncbi:DUF1592 domain-containing protein [Prosthecobacter sp.]|uniref:DUF1592 domain-containing protein n=1 Tax=Prosthecobacter sp. TaxID=1965333 RepID=UPI003783B02A
MKGFFLSFLLLSVTVQAADVSGFLEVYCLDCHDSTAKKGGLDLSGLTDEPTVIRNREMLRAVFEKVESHQMPPPKQKNQPQDSQRAEMMAWIMDVAARPDPALGTADPGKPALRRLTRLEYNNAVRDLFELDLDVFMFPERLPLADTGYFQPASGKMPAVVKVPLREYGQKYPVLCRNLGLPGDGRAEHGYSNRGDVMSFSPALLEKYLAAASEIVNAPQLVERSEIAARLFGVPPVAGKTSPAPGKDALRLMTAHALARDAKQWKKTEGSADNAPQRFFEDVREGVEQSNAGVFDSGDAVRGVTLVPGKGGLLRVAYAGGAKCLTINPNADLWLAGFATAMPTSGSRIFTNHSKGDKVFELTFGIENGEEDEAVSRLGIFVLGRKGQSGHVTITAKFSDETESSLSGMIAEGPAGTTFFSFAAVPGESVKSLLVDGSQFSGDYVVLDDLGFITSGQPRAVARQTLPAKAAPGEIAVSAPLRLAAFMERAFRRSVSEGEKARFITLFEEEQKRGSTEAAAMKAAVAAVLASPGFLYLEANGTPGDARVSPLEDHELASRLAAFLWSSIPDAELLALAKANKLRDPALLEAQTRRMLKSPRSRELGESFAVQWLRLDQLSTSKPDPDLFKSFYSGPQGKSTLHGAMLTEALLLFQTVQVEDRSILDFIAADYTWLNGGLAKLYGIPLNVGDPVVAASTGGGPTREVKSKGDGGLWHRVNLTDASRGGYIGMAAPMVITSLPFRTSPVKRGAWILETLFNRPPTEPKIAFAFEDDSKDAARQMSIRERFEAHRSKAACYSCHIRLDPPGFALERFNPIGAWNDQADARSEWNGQAFDGPAGFKSLLAANPGEFTRGFIEHLLSYALGRELHTYDMPVVEKIGQAAKADGWKFSRIVVEIAKSYPFTHVRH